MAGPMAYLAPGHRSVTAWAITWAVEWRRMYRPSGVSAVRTATVAPSGRVHPRSRVTPSTVAAIAALASRGPMAAARSAAVAPAGNSRDEPSGRDTVIVSAIAAETTGADEPDVRIPAEGQSTSPEGHAEQRRRL